MFLKYLNAMVREEFNEPFGNLPKNQQQREFVKSLQEIPFKGHDAKFLYFDIDAKANSRSKIEYACLMELIRGITKIVQEFIVEDDTCTRRS
jgi:hypothetical protein